MAISTFAELKTAMGNWLDRSDLSSRLPEFIALFEAKINRKLALRQQTTTTTLTPSGGSVALPTDYLDAKKLTWTGTPNRVLDYLDPGYFGAFYAAGSSGNPVNYTIEGSNIKVGPIDNTNLTFLYAQKVPALSDSATTNWFLTSHPDGYLFGSLTMAATFTEDAANGTAWNSLAQDVLGDLWDAEFRSRPPMVQKVMGATP